jgi:hypothetical protein
MLTEAHLYRKVHTAHAAAYRLSTGTEPKPYSARAASEATDVYMKPHGRPSSAVNVRSKLVGATRSQTKRSESPLVHHGMENEDLVQMIHALRENIRDLEQQQNIYKAETQRLLHCMSMLTLCL